MLREPDIHDEIEQLVTNRVNQRMAIELRALADKYDGGGNPQRQPRQPRKQPVRRKRGKKASHRAVAAKAAKPQRTQRKSKHPRGFLVKVVKQALTDTPATAAQVFDRVHRKHPEVEQTVVTKTLAQLNARKLLQRSGVAKSFKYARLAK